MKYNINIFNKEVAHYKALLKKNKIGNDILVIFDIDDGKSFYSIAPLSLAVHELKKEMAVIDSQSESITVLWNFWQLKSQMDAGLANEAATALKEFLNILNDKTKGEFNKIIQPPKNILIAKKGEFRIIDTQDFLNINKLSESSNNSNLELKSKSEPMRIFSKAKSNWHKKPSRLLDKTSKILWDQVYDLKKNESSLVVFETIGNKDIRKKPVNDYLDSYSVAYSMAKAAKKMCRNASLVASSAKKTAGELQEKISDLIATLQGCELDKNIDEPVFKKFKIISESIYSEKLKPKEAIFVIKGEGYCGNQIGYTGRHLFGQTIGYPTMNKKSRWSSPLKMAMKLAYSPQTKDEERLPMSRLAITDTIPLDIFIETNNIDWYKLEKRNREIMAIIEKSDTIKVIGKGKKVGRMNLQTDFTVFIKNEKTNKRRHPLSSGTDTRTLIDQDFLDREGIVAGNYGNIPGGEAFMTPEYIKGRFVGDVVISIDRSYVIPKNNPLVIDCDENGHKIIVGDKKIISTLNKERNASLKQLDKMEKSGAVSHEIANLNRNNFKKIGEFAINTNPKAKLCNYLIVNEKIANMMHIALGSGFDADRASTYHYDIVINARAQKMNVYGETFDKNGKRDKQIWILKNGRFVV